MTTEQLNELFWTTGHFRNPEFPNLHNVTKEQALKLTDADPIRAEVIRSYQRYFEEELSELTQIAHGRIANADGQSGPATEVLVAGKRCMHPDFDVPDDPEITKLWTREEANWPDACCMDLEFGRNFDALPGMSKEETDGIYHAIANNWTAAIADVTITPVDERQPPDDVRGWHHLEAMSGGVLAWNYLAQNRCDVRLTGAWNKNVNWGGDGKLPSTTGTHEAGHWLGMNHNNDSRATLYPSVHSHSMARYGYPNQTDINTLKALGYTVHDDWESRKPSLEVLFKPRSGETPDPEPPTDDEWRKHVEGELTQLRAAVASQNVMIQHLLQFHR